MPNPKFQGAEEVDIASVIPESTPPMSHFGEFYDVLTGTHIRDPARAEDGEIYDFTTLSEWFDSREADGLPIISPRTLAPMGRTLTRDAEALARLDLVMGDLALNVPGVSVKTLKVLRAVFDALGPLGDLLNTILDGWKVRDRHAWHRIAPHPHTSTHARALSRRRQSWWPLATSRAASPR